MLSLLHISVDVSALDHDDSGDAEDGSGGDECSSGCSPDGGQGDDAGADPEPKAGKTEQSTSIIDLAENNDKDMDNGTKPRQQEEEQESNAWQSQNITHIDSTTQHAHVIHTNTGHQTLQFPRAMQGTTSLITATEGRKDEDRLQLRESEIYMKSMRRLMHYRKLDDEVMDTYITKLCKQPGRIDCSNIPSLYAQKFMDDDFNYIHDERTIAQLSRRHIFRSQIVFLPVGRNGHWSLATADMRTREIYHEDPISGAHGNRNKNGATIMLNLLADTAKMAGEEFDASSWTCYNSRYIRPPQQTGYVDCGVFVCAYATLRRQELDVNLFHQTHNQWMRLYIANTILGDTSPPLTTWNTASTQQT